MFGSDEPVAEPQNPQEPEEFTAAAPQHVLDHLADGSQEPAQADDNRDAPVEADPAYGTQSLGPQPPAPEGPFLAEAQHPVSVAAPTAPRTAIRVGDSEAVLTVDGTEFVFSGDELHNLRRQIDAAYLELH